MSASASFLPFIVSDRHPYTPFYLPVYSPFLLLETLLSSPLARFDKKILADGEELVRFFCASNISLQNLRKGIASKRFLQVQQLYAPSSDQVSLK
jgi:hypothetical protein